MRKDGKADKQGGMTDVYKIRHGVEKEVGGLFLLFFFHNAKI